MTAERLLLRPEEAADVLGISRARLYQLLATGDIASVTIGRSRRVPVAVLQEYVNRRLAEAGR